MSSERSSPVLSASFFRGGDIDGLTGRFGLLAWPKLPNKVIVIDRRPDFDNRVRTPPVRPDILELHRYSDAVHSSGTPALRRPAKTVVSYKVRMVELS